MGSTIRKLCSIAFLSYTHKRIDPTAVSFNDSHFGHTQYGLKNKGTEQIIHSIRYSMERYPENDVFLMDADNLPCFDHFRSSVTHLTDLNPIVTEAYVLDTARTGQIKHLQHHLFEKISKVLTNVFLEIISNNRAKVWFRALQDSDAGLWLDTAPKSHMHRMSSQAFTKALRLHLFLPMNSSLHGLTCPCGNRLGIRRVDDQGLHFIT
jgi:hypothetical protein